MYDLCTRPEPSQGQKQQQTPPSTEGEPEGSDAVEPTSVTGHQDTEKTPGGQGTNPGQEAAITSKFGMPGSVLGKRQHSMYEGVNGCEVAGYGKVSLMHVCLIQS